MHNFIFIWNIFSVEKRVYHVKTIPSLLSLLLCTSIGQIDCNRSKNEIRGNLCNLISNFYEKFPIPSNMFSHVFFEVKWLTRMKNIFIEKGNYMHVHVHERRLNIQLLYLDVKLSFKVHLSYSTLIFEESLRRVESNDKFY